MHRIALAAAALIVGCWFVAVGDVCRAADRAEIVRCEMGFGNEYRLGVWVPLRVTVLGGPKPAQFMVSAIAPDSDGLGVLYSTSPQRPFAVLPGQEKTVELLVRVGQTDAPILVRGAFEMDGKRYSQSVTLSPGMTLEDGGIYSGSPATSRHLLEIGGLTLGVGDAFERENDDKRMTRMTRVSDLSKLPRDPLGYDSIDTIVLTTSEAGELLNMLPGDPRMQALQQWVRRGGKLIVSCGRNATRLLADDGALSRIVKCGSPAETTVNDLTAIENYAEGRDPLGKRDSTQVTIATFDELPGRVLVQLGEEETATPVIVEQRLGLGRVLFLAFDLNQAPFRGWKPLKGMLRKLVDGAAEPKDYEDNNYYYYMYGGMDMSDQMRSRLDEQLEASGVRTPPFLAIAGLVVLYILLIGPVDYWFVRKYLGRMEATWITFPAIVVLTCAGAYWLAYYLKGNELIVNTVEVVDVDTTSGRTRGTLWHHLFSPQPNRYTMSVLPKSENDTEVAKAETSIAWLGQTGQGLGRMGSNASPNPLRSSAYNVSSDHTSVANRPVQVWSTKTSVGRWYADLPSGMSSELSYTDVVEGTITNNTGADLSGCFLVHNDWIWQLGNFPDGRSATIDSDRRPVKIRTFLQSEMSFEEDDEYWSNEMSRLDVRETALMMMFSERFMRDRYQSYVNRYQHDVDLSHLLNDETAMLIGQVNAPRSVLVEQEQPVLSSGDGGMSITLYRYLLPVTVVNSEN